MFESELRSIDADIIERFKEEYGPEPYMHFPGGALPILQCQLIRSVQRLTAAIEALDTTKHREPKHWQPSPEELARMQEGAE